MTNPKLVSPPPELPPPPKPEVRVDKPKVSNPLVVGSVSGRGQPGTSLIDATDPVPAGLVAWQFNDAGRIGQQSRLMPCTFSITRPVQIEAATRLEVAGGRYAAEPPTKAAALVWFEYEQTVGKSPRPLQKLVLAQDPSRTISPRVTITKVEPEYEKRRARIHFEAGLSAPTGGLVNAFSCGLGGGAGDSGETRAALVLSWSTNGRRTFQTYFLSEEDALRLSRRALGPPSDENPGWFECSWPFAKQPAGLDLSINLLVWATSRQASVGPRAFSHAELCSTYALLRFD
ncbi:MAG: hypothetical protein H6807_08495 [Planctomycetes bacterium]|nr:hypothetical protein [Planctomycetota bacterium]